MAESANLEWLTADTVPDDVANIIVAGTMLCCHPGAKIVLVGGRIAGEWVLPLEHNVLITHYMLLPAHPAEARH